MFASWRVAVVSVVAGLAACPGVASASGWTIESVPAPALATSSRLTAASCPSSESCVAVGYWEGPSTTKLGFTDQPFAERWNGTSWSEQNLPAPGGAGNAELTGVSCSSSSACTAVGYSSVQSGAASTDTAFAERWDGQSWYVQAVANPAPQTRLLGVSCSSLTSCTAVGTAEGPGASAAAEYTTPVAEQWNGNDWSTLGQRLPPDSRFAGVSCLDSAACVAAGSRPAGPLAEQWDGFVWIPQTTRDPFKLVSGAGPAFTGVSCTDATVCTAVGYDHAGGGVETGPAFAEQLNEGVLWHYQPIVSPPGATGEQLSAVSCVSGWECHAVGTYYTGSNAKASPLWAYWNGTGWQTSEPPSAVGSSQSSLQGVACAQDGSCVAVGSSVIGPGGTAAPFVLRYA